MSRLQQRIARNELIYAKYSQKIDEFVREDLGPACSADSFSPDSSTSLNKISKSAFSAIKQTFSHRKSELCTQLTEFSNNPQLFLTSNPLEDEVEKDISTLIDSIESWLSQHNSTSPEIDKFTKKWAMEIDNYLGPTMSSKPHEQLNPLVSSSIENAYQSLRR